MKTPPRIAIPIPTLADPEYNLRSWANYADAITTAGGDPVEVPLTLAPAKVAALIATCRAILLPGSPADVDPQRYGQERTPECAAPDLAREQVDIQLLEDAHRHRKPIFGICFGTQMLNVWRGGTLVQDLSILPVNHRAGRSVTIAHAVSVAPQSVLGTLLAGHEETAREAPVAEGFLRLPINSSHHQAVGIPGQGLHVAARCPQDAVIEAVEGDSPDHFVLAVQWHPERIFRQSAAAKALFTHFVREATAWSAVQSPE